MYDLFFGKITFFLNSIEILRSIFLTSFDVQFFFQRKSIWIITNGKILF